MQGTASTCRSTLFDAAQARCSLNVLGRDCRRTGTVQSWRDLLCHTQSYAYIVFQDKHDCSACSLLCGFGVIIIFRADSLHATRPALHKEGSTM